jgi:hypothetical protein
MFMTNNQLLIQLIQLKARSENSQPIVIKSYDCITFKATALF